MSQDKPEFDHFSDAYEQLAAHPIRDRFGSGGSEFFRPRKRALIRADFQRRRTDTRKLDYLDLGCGKGELASLLRSAFPRVAGCDPSEGMLSAGELVSKGIEARVQDDPGRIPFEGALFRSEERRVGKECRS